MMLWYGSHLAFWEVTLMWVGMIAFWALIIWAVWALVAAVTRRPSPDERGDDARRILDQRLARGEVDADEYRRLRELLDGDRHSQVSSGDRRRPPPPHRSYEERVTTPTSSSTARPSSPSTPSPTAGASGRPTTSSAPYDLCT